MTICEYSQYMDVSQMSITRWMDKEDMVHIYYRMLLGHEKHEIMPFTATWMDLEIIISTVRQKQIIIWYYSREI